METGLRLGLRVGWRRRGRAGLRGVKREPPRLAAGCEAAANGNAPCAGVAAPGPPPERRPGARALQRGAGLGPARPGSAHYGAVRSGSARLGPAHSGAVRLLSVRFASARPRAPVIPGAVGGREGGG